MTPLWILPIYPLLLVGPMAAAIAKVQPQKASFNILFAGVAMQGIGFMIALMIYSAFISRLMTAKLPRSRTRPGMFISVGPSGFTIFGVIKMSQALALAMPSDFLGNGQLMARVTQLGTLWIGVWLWGLATWFFLISITANLGRVVVAGKEVEFTLGWWSFVFPNSELLLQSLSGT
jgi:tellurite resistance protein TehA-like permease